MGLMWLVVLGTSIWMAVDASQHEYDPHDISGLGGMGPAGWFFCGLLLWIVAFPLYLVKRGELKEAGERRKQLLALRHAQQVQQAQLPPAAGYGAPGYGAPGYGAPGYGAPGYGAPGYGAPQGYPPAGYPPAGYPQPPVAGQGVAPGAAAEPPLTAEQLAEQINKLNDLRVAGLLTEDEFQQQKMRLLSRT